MDCCMRIQSRKKNASRLSPREQWTLLGALALLIVPTVLFLQVIDNCVSGDVRTHAPYTDFPGLDWYRLPLSERPRVADQLNRRLCTCQCLMTLGACRNRHTSCRTSLRIGDELVQSAQRSPSPVGRP